MMLHVLNIYPYLCQKYPKAIFNTISEYRQKQIESLGINNKQI